MTSRDWTLGSVPREIVAGCQCGKITFQDDHGNVFENRPRQIEFSPSRCPVCDGRGTVPMGFYNHTYDGRSSSTAEPPTEPCRSCDGTGVVWK